jgi:hypothetical protein
MAAASRHGKPRSQRQDLPKPRGVWPVIDIYCERTGPGLLAEPVNAITNLAFLLAALACWRLAGRQGVMSADIRLLIALMAAIGIGSGLFHTFATGWSQLLDILPILLFQVAYLWIYDRRIIGMGTGWLVTSVVLLVGSSLYGRQFPELLNGSLIYAPALVMLISLGTYHYRHAAIQPALLLQATGVFLLSLSMRTVDEAVCAHLPLGTHFLWHLLNGLLVYLIVRGLLLNLPVSSRQSG